MYGMLSVVSGSVVVSEGAITDLIPDNTSENWSVTFEPEDGLSSSLAIEATFSTETTDTVDIRCIASVTLTCRRS
jgi:hypothetical protein